MKLESQPDWGMGLVTKDLPQHWELFFENAGERKFVKAMATTLIPVTLLASELAALELKAYGRHARAAAGATRSRASSPAGTKARFATIDEQLAFFETLFPGGFTGESFIKAERGVPGATGRNGLKEAALMIAQELSLEHFESAAPEALYESAKKVLQATTMVFPMEGAIPFAGIDVDSRAGVLDALKHLLHGDGDYADRLERFAGAIQLKDKKGEAKAATWPFATIFGAFVRPDEWTCVKPTAFACQAVTVGLSVAKSQPVTAAGYRKFAEVATKTKAALEAAGQQPRDLIDVYSFIWRTHHDKPS